MNLDPVLGSAVLVRQSIPIGGEELGDHDIRKRVEKPGPDDAVGEKGASDRQAENTDDDHRRQSSLKKALDGDSKILEHQVLGESRWRLNPVASGWGEKCSHFFMGDST